MTENQIKYCVKGLATLLTCLWFGSMIRNITDAYDYELLV